MSTSTDHTIKIESGWKAALAPVFGAEHFKHIQDFVTHAYTTSTVYPHPTLMFRAFEMCPFDQVKVVILGQDPYHGEGQANGLSFAVPTGVNIPPSLRHIFKEIQNDCAVIPLTDGDLTRWAKQGVLLLNSTLTVEAHKPGSHQHKGWEEFTDAVIQIISEQKEHIVFLLWGNYAKKKGQLINRKKHLVLEAPHPSPFSVHTGFFGCKHFSKTNAYLKEHGLQEIDWR